MSALARLQRDFLDAMFDDAAPADAGMAIYRRNVLANLHNALAQTYPVVRRLVGEAFFREAAERFARAHTASSGDLNRYGGELAAFLAAYPFARELPYLPDVARLEWACHESFHAADAAGLDAAALAAVPAQLHGEIRFTLHPAVRLVDSSHPVMSIWEANQPERDGAPDAHEGGELVVVRREEGMVRLARVPQAEWRFIAALARAATLEEALAAADSSAEDFLAPLLARLVASGVICAFTAPGDSA